MKKRAILYFIVASAVFASCKKDKTVFSETADERLNKVLTSYQVTLINAPYGWKGFIFPAGMPTGVFGFYFKFKAANRVEMFSDFDSLSNVTVMESSWRLKALQQPSLIFDTYSYVTVLADPDASVNGGQYGSGLLSDFEFAINGVSGDTIKLTGRKNSSKAYLVKASKQDMDDYYNKKHTNRLFDNISKYLTYFKRITIGGITYEIVANAQTKTVTITWVDGSGVAHSVTTGYYYTATGIGFIPPVTNGSTTISGFDNITWDAINSILTVSVNGTSTTIAPAATPIAPDPNVSTRWYQYAAGQGGYWITPTGFHVNGVDDAFNITKIANFYFLMYQPSYGVSGTTPYDITGYVKLIGGGLQLNYAPAFRVPTTFANGRMTFSYLGYLGTIPTADSIPVAKTRILFTDASGYYFVQLNDTHYDMVSAKDGKSWIHWQY